VKNDPLAVTYARALVELASEGGKLADVLEDVRFIRGLLVEDREFRTFIESPGIGGGAKREVLEKSFRGKLGDLALDFVELVVEKHRQTMLISILDACEDLYDLLEGRMRVEATSAVPLDDRGRDELTKTLGAKLRKSIVLESKVRPEIMGGLIVRVGDMVADDSVLTALQRIERSLEEARIGSEILK
jgi:F-type H+-transporting ATPase subunit delta